MKLYNEAKFAFGKNDTFCLVLVQKVSLMVVGFGLIESDPTR